MSWDRTGLALRVLAVDPAGIKGLWLRARASAVRDRVTDALSALPLPLVRLHPGVGDEALYGGLDLPATLAAGRPVRMAGLFDQPSALILTMAERCGGGLAARLAQVLDGPGFCVVALDESADEDEGLPPALTDRLGLFVDLSDEMWSDTTPFDMPDLAAARALLPAVAMPPDGVAALTRAAVELGIGSMRAPMLAVAVARALAALAGRNTVDEADQAQAADLAYGHRAGPLADAPPPEQQPEPPPPEDTTDDNPETESENENQSIPEEMLVEAARAALPQDLLDRLAAGRAARVSLGASGTGAAKSGNRRGRPLPSRPGSLGGGVRIDLVATMRAAAPWQPMRRATALRPGATLQVRGADIRVKRFVETSDRVLIFAVDASGSSAFARLAEAKGAIELLLAAAYARRDHVALLAFRGREAEVILPPTRSLVQTKRRLQGLPGGGGTPLAAGMQLAMMMALQARGRGMTPTIAILTDGRGNIALDGSANREAAEADAITLARAILSRAIPTVVIDTANRPQPGLRAMAVAMDAPYIALPRADAQRLSGVLGAALGE
jgi:magnesium chelatase subunit D